MNTGKVLMYFVRTSRYFPENPAVLQYSRVERISSASAVDDSQVNEIAFHWLRREISGELTSITMIEYGLNTAHYSGQKLSAAEIKQVWEQAEKIFSKEIQEKVIQPWGIEGRDNGLWVIERGRRLETVLELEYQDNSIRLRALGSKQGNPTALIGNFNLNSLGGKIYENSSAQLISGAEYCVQEGFAQLPLEGRTMDEIINNDRVIF